MPQVLSYYMIWKKKVFFPYKNIFISLQNNSAVNGSINNNPGSFACPPNNLENSVMLLLELLLRL